MVGVDRRDWGGSGARVAVFITFFFFAAAAASASGTGGNWWVVADDWLACGRRHPRRRRRRRVTRLVMFQYPTTPIFPFFSLKKLWAYFPSRGQSSQEVLNL